MEYDYILVIGEAQLVFQLIQSIIPCLAQYSEVEFKGNVLDPCIVYDVSNCSESNPETPQ